MRKRILFSVFLLVFLLAIPAYGLAENTPSFTNVFTQKVSDVYVSGNFNSDHTLFSLSDNKIFRSQDGGSAWQETGLYIDNVFYSADKIYLFDMLCTNNNTIYLSGYNKDRKEYFLVKSIDAGSNWTPLYNHAFYSLYSANDWLYGIDKNKKSLQGSDNFGVQWNWALKSQVLLRNYAFTTTDGKSLFTVYDKKLWSKVNDQDWKSIRYLNSDKTNLFSFVDNEKNIIIACDPENTADVSISYDNGISWDAVNFGSDAKILTYKINCATAAPGGFLFLGTANKCILVSEDYGKTWKIISKGVTASVASIKSVVEGDSIKVFAATPSGLLSMSYHINTAEEIATIKSTVKFIIGKTSFSIGGQDKTMDVAPFVSGDRSFVPIKYMGEALGADVSWGEVTQTVTIKKDNTVVVVPLGKKVIVVNGVEIPMDVKAMVRNDRTYLPAKYVAEAFGYTVDWDEATKTVKISKK